jgi:hypothetical protein
MNILQDVLFCEISVAARRIAAGVPPSRSDYGEPIYAPTFPNLYKFPMINAKTVAAKGARIRASLGCKSGELTGEGHREGLP